MNVRPQAFSVTFPLTNAKHSSLRSLSLSLMSLMRVRVIMAVSISMTCVVTL